MAEVERVEGTQRGDTCPEGYNYAIESEGLGNHEANTITGDRLANPDRLSHIDGHWFFQMDVFASKCGFLAYGYIEGRGKGHDYGVDGLIS